MKLDGSIISLEFAPLTKCIKIGNIPPGTSSDDVKYKFSSRKICGGQVTEVKLDKKSGVANVYFEKSSGMGLPHCVYFTRFLQRPYYTYEIIFSATCNETTYVTQRLTQSRVM